MADEIKVTLRGRVATNPTCIATKSGPGFTHFRLAHTPRHYDAATGSWRDGQTEWFTVVVEREHLQATTQFSARKGVPVIVVGRLRTRRWTAADGAERWTMEVRAETIGVDLAFGIASFARYRPMERDEADGDEATPAVDLPPAATASVADPSDGGPTDPSPAPADAGQEHDEGDTAAGDGTALGQTELAEVPA